MREGMVSSINSGLNALFASFSEIEALKNARVPTIAPATGGDVGSATPDQSSRKSQTPFVPQVSRESSFGDIARPKATLAPADELALFAENGELETAADEAYPVGLRDSGTPEPTAQQYNFQLRKPSYVAQLYAQTNDITFSTDTILKQAA
jgi:hypothetical protein